MKKVQVESRILELIKSGEYATIEIKTVDGKLSHYEKTEKIKITSATERTVLSIKFLK